MSRIIATPRFKLKPSLVVFGAMFAVALCAALFAVRGVSAQSNAWVDSHVYWASPAAGSAKSTVVGWENECTDAFNTNKASMPSGTTAQQRAVVNASAYVQNVWVTRKNNPQNTNMSSVTSGTTVDMQINEMLFLCAIITMDPSGFAIASSHKVTNSQYANDRAPVPDSSASQYKVNQASRYESNSKIYNVSVQSGPAGSSIVNEPVGSVIGYKRDNNSRYWNASPVPFGFKTSSSLATGTYKITIRVDYATIQTYHAYGSAGTSRCTLKSTGDGADVSYGNFNICTVYTAYYTFNLNVQSPIPPQNLQPSVLPKINGTAANGNVAQVGDTISFDYSVYNSGGTSNNTACSVYTSKYTGYHNVSNPADKGTLTTANTGCPRNFASGTTALTNATQTIQADTANQTICSSLFVNPASPSVGELGGEACVQVAARPYAKVFGGDASAGNSFGTSCTQNSTAGIAGWNQESGGGYAGSGTQYAAQALGNLLDFASAQNTNGAAAPYGLSFANTNRTASIFGGGFGSLGDCLPDYYGGLPPTAIAKSAADLSDISNIGSGIFKETGDVTMSGNINPNQRTVLYVKGNVFIDNPIRFPGSWSYDKTPLFELIVQGNIYIKNTVTDIAGTYIAQSDGATGGGIYTCTTSASPLALSGSIYNTCANTQLTINGQFIANQIYLMRTKNSLNNSNSNETNTSSNAAEIFNYTPANWIAQPPAGSNNNTGSVGGYDAISTLPPVL